MRKPIIGIIGKVQPQYGQDIWDIWEADMFYIPRVEVIKREMAYATRDLSPLKDKKPNVLEQEMERQKTLLNEIPSFLFEKDEKYFEELEKRLDKFVKKGIDLKKAYYDKHTHFGICFANELSYDMFTYFHSRFFEEWLDLKQCGRVSNATRHLMYDVYIGRVFGVCSKRAIKRARDKYEKSEDYNFARKRHNVICSFGFWI